MNIPCFVRRARPLAVLAAALTLAATSSVGVSAPAAARPAETFAGKTRGLERRAGLLTTWLDRKGGRLLLELPAPSGPRGECGSFLYLEGIRSGLGSNPVGLDRGQIGRTAVVNFRRVGGRVLVEQPNLRYRARTPDAGEVRAVRESFATSVLWAGEVAAEASDGRLLVDFTSFVVRDAHGVAATLQRAGQGSFSLDRERSVLDADECKSFPDNLEFGSLLTFSSTDPGPEVRETAPDPQAVTIVQHHSLVKLPDDGYRPRAWDPRSGSFALVFADYAAPIGDDLDVRWLERHRLEKADPTAARSRAKQPLVYYVDSGVPEPIRSALVEGASWWSRAFEAAGFIDAFQVKVLPPDVDPLDVRYNVIQWVHRATRGWSYGNSIVDPRTGEIIKGQVSLGSLRIREDRLIFEGLAGVAKTGTGAPDDPIQLSLARIRQLAAHEVGHTLGFSHNFAASTYGDRASVMDYPAPRIGVRGDSLDFTGAYGVGVGVWDIQQVRYAYTEFASPEAEKAGLAAILRENREKGYRYLSDSDTRPAGAGAPYAAMWDNGPDPIAGLAHELEVRRIALARFGEANLAAGRPQGRLAAVLAPLYFHHRYALEAAAKSIGGLDYAYAVAGEGDPPATPVPPARQREALRAVVATLDPAILDLPESVLRLLPPPPAGDPAHHEYFDSNTAPAFDALGAAATAADLTLSMLLPPERLARVVDFHRRDPSSPGLDEVLHAITHQVFDVPAPATERLRAVRRAIQAVTVRRLIDAAGSSRPTPEVHAGLEAALDGLRNDLARVPRTVSPADRALALSLWRDIGRYFDRTSAAGPTAAPGEAPPGPPIGAWAMDDECEGVWGGR